MIASGGTMRPSQMLREAGARRICVLRRAASSLATHWSVSAAPTSSTRSSSPTDPLPLSADGAQRQGRTYLHCRRHRRRRSKIHKKQSLRDNHLTVYQPLREDGRFEGQSGE